MGHALGLDWHFGGLESHLVGSEAILASFWVYHGPAGGHLADFG